MQLFRRPTAPSTFPRAWETAKTKAERLIEQRLKKQGGNAAPPDRPKSGRGARKKGKTKKVFPELWRNYKALFAYAQFDKCGFCESSILTTSYGDVEHYRPKSEISQLSDDPETFGRQKEASANIKGRQVTLVSPTGYYWLAYDWSNYLLACSNCNAIFKGTLFPVKDEPRSLPPLKTQPPEKALLLNPFDEKDPADHLKFTREGFILARTLHGRATIDTCGLYREALVKAREQIARRAYDLAKELRRPRSRQNLRLLQDCYDIGKDEAEYCGMVRYIFGEIGNVTWEQLVKKRATELATRLKNTRDRERRNQMEQDLEYMGRDRFEHSLTVRKIFEKTRGIKWDQLVASVIEQSAVEFLALKKDWSLDQQYELQLKKRLYLMARDNPLHATIVQEAYEKICKMDWAALRAFVELRYDFLWKLP
ncbi:MAG TPA: hypothetical protein VJS64_01875 [Pyrinomonadaceae bacterium]|nr:hypothetical protein [Pyrinomonadaceae bacterium]